MMFCQCLVYYVGGSAASWGGSGGPQRDPQVQLMLLCGHMLHHNESQAFCYLVAQSQVTPQAFSPEIGTPLSLSTCVLLLSFAPFADTNDVVSMAIVCHNFEFNPVWCFVTQERATDDDGVPEVGPLLPGLKQRRAPEAHSRTESGSQSGL